MGIKVGEYVRVKNDGIGKVVNINIHNDKIVYYEVDNGNIFNSSPECITKHSPNIIDLIEEGDYVNGCRVVNIITNDGKKIGVAVDSGVWAFDACEIKTIVTHGQMREMEYKV